MKSFLKFIGWLIALALITLYTMRAPDSDPKAMIAKYGAAPSKFLKLEDHLVIHMRDEGPEGAPVIVLLHGSNADLHTWQPWTEALEGKYRVIRYDQIGHGLTGADPRGDYSIAGQQARLEQFVDVLGLKKFVLIGNSMGGNLALAYAMKHPERLSGLVLVDAGGAPITEKGKSNLGFKLAATPGLSWLMQEVTPRWIVEKSLRQSVSNQQIVSEAMIDRYWDLLRYPGNRPATMQRFALPRVPFTTRQLAGVKVPTLIMWGEEDSLIPFQAAKMFNLAIPGSKLVSYKGIGHLPMEENAAQSVGDLQGWLAGLSQPR